MAQRQAVEDLFAECRRSAVHLEMRDTYTPDDPTYLDWRAGVKFDPVDRFRDWHDLVRGMVRRGVEVRRARIVSEPVTDFIRHEYEVTSILNLPAGEKVRWLPRHRASDLALPGNDFWLFDEEVVRFGHFAGDGTYIGDEISGEVAVAKLCADAFEAVWERAVEHELYRPA